MKKIIGTVSLALVCLGFNAVSFATNSVKGDIKACTNYTQYFQFANKYKDPQFGMFITAKKFNVDTTLTPWAQFNPGVSDTFTNTFTSDEQGILTGEALFVGEAKKPKNLCSITYSCECDATKGCVYEVTVVGTRCDISKGQGTANNPYTILLK